MSADDLLSPGQFAAHMQRMKEQVIGQRHAEYPEKPEMQFHGTAASLPPGEKLTIGRPSNYTGSSTSGGNVAPGKTMDKNAQHVYSTPDITSAYMAANVAATNKANAAEGIGLSSAQRNYYGSIPQPHVYEVHSTGKMTRDPEIDREDWVNGNEAYRSRQPLRVGQEVSRGAKAEYISDFGADYGQER